MPNGAASASPSRTATSRSPASSIPARIVGLGFRPEQGSAHGFAPDVFGVAGALPLLLELQLLDHLLFAEAGDALHALEAPVALDLFGRAWIGRLTVGLGAAPEAEEVVIKALVVGVDLGAALVAHAFVPRAAGVHAVVFPAKIIGVGLAGDDFVGIAG